MTATLRYSNSHGVASGFDGVVTSLPKPGDIIGQGQELAEVGDEPSYLMHGSVPAWRELNIDSTNG
ncbi:peptidoglycan-binding protein, partial [Actinotignum schaalii]|nr:peptidoglycan-binding protein [Actinotignum schaalii]